MTIVEVFTGLLLTLSIVAAAVMMYVGLLCVLDIIHFVRCDTCGHLGLSTREEAMSSCSYCRHGALWHPVVTLHRALSPHVSHVLPQRHPHGR